MSGSLEASHVFVLIYSLFSEFNFNPSYIVT